MTIWCDITQSRRSKGPTPPRVMLEASARLLARKCQKDWMHPVRLVSTLCWRHPDGVAFVMEVQLASGLREDSARDWLLWQCPKWTFAEPEQDGHKGRPYATQFANTGQPG